MKAPARKLATWEDLWEEVLLDRKCEVVNGEIVEKAGGDDRHSGTQAHLTASVLPLFGRRGGAGNPGGWWIRTEPDIYFEVHNILRPDVAGWRRERTPVMPDGWPIRATPDWVCEILSRSTAGRDLGEKRRIYHRHNVEHYWIVDPANRVLTVLRRGKTEYLHVLAAGPSETVRAEPFDAIEIYVGQFFGFEPGDEIPRGP